MKGQSQGESTPKTNKNPISITKILAQVAALGGIEGINAQQRRAELLTNGYRSPMPGKMYNQRQKRKTARQTGVYC